MGSQTPPSPSAFRYRDDVHSPRHKGFIYSHVGWIFSRQHDVTDLVKVADLPRYPELMWLHKFELLPAVMLARALLSGCRLVRPGGRILLEHGAASITRRSASIRWRMCAAARATSRATIPATTGCWRSSRWAKAGTTTITPTRAAFARAFAGGRSTPPSMPLKALAWTGLVWDLKTPPAAVLRNEHRLGARVIERAAAQLAASFNPELIVRRDHVGVCRVRACLPCRRSLRRRSTGPPTCSRPGICRNCRPVTICSRGRAPCLPRRLRWRTSSIARMPSFWTKLARG